MKQWFMGIVFSFCVLSLGNQLPVDSDIQDLKTQIAHLEFLKGTLGARSCQVTYDGNQVGLTPGALRSQGIRMAIGRKFPGDYLAFHNEPKPFVLLGWIAQTFEDKSKVEGAVLVSATVTQVEGTTQPTSIRLEVHRPVLSKNQVDDDPSNGYVLEWEYKVSMMHVFLPLPKGEFSQQVRVGGTPFVFGCKSAN